MASVASLAEFPAQIKDVFLTKTMNKAGIYAVKFYIRGKPWVVEVDDRMLFRKSDVNQKMYLKFA